MGDRSLEILRKSGAAVHQECDQPYQAQKITP
jgi:hypothetical protein